MTILHARMRPGFRRSLSTVALAAFVLTAAFPVVASVDGNGGHTFFSERHKPRFHSFLVPASTVQDDHYWKFPWFVWTRQQGWNPFRVFSSPMLANKIPLDVN
jgi:hypothetical protein